MGKVKNFKCKYYYMLADQNHEGCRGRDHMVVGFTTT